jgi:riboflavin synthase alpha subunit
MMPVNICNHFFLKTNLISVQEVRNQNSVRTLVITAEKILEDMHIGDSISVNGSSNIFSAVITNVRTEF